MLSYLKKWWPFVLKSTVNKLSEEQVIQGDTPALWRFVDIEGNDLREHSTEEIVLVDEQKVKELLKAHLSQYQLVGNKLKLLMTATSEESAPVLNHIYRHHFKDVALDKPRRVVSIEISYGEVEVASIRNLMTDKVLKPNCTKCMISGDVLHYTVGTLEWEDLS